MERECIKDWYFNDALQKCSPCIPECQGSIHSRCTEVCAERNAHPWTVTFTEIGQSGPQLPDLTQTTVSTRLDQRQSPLDDAVLIYSFVCVIGMIVLILSIRKRRIIIRKIVKFCCPEMNSGERYAQPRARYHPDAYADRKSLHKRPSDQRKNTESNNKTDALTFLATAPFIDDSGCRGRRGQDETKGKTNHETDKIDKEQELRETIV